MIKSLFMINYFVLLVDDLQIYMNANNWERIPPTHTPPLYWWKEPHPTLNTIPTLTLSLTMTLNLTTILNLSLTLPKRLERCGQIFDQ